MNTRPIRTKVAATLVVGALAFTVAACDDSGTSKVSASQKQGQADANSIYTKFDRIAPYPYRNENPTSALERENLARRLKQLNDKSTVGYVYLLAPNTAQVIGYYTITGKVSSTGSQLTSSQILQQCSSDAAGGSCSVVDAVGDDGTYGPEEGGPNGVFFFTTAGVLVETVMPWVYSTQPMKIYANAPQLDAKG